MYRRLSRQCTGGGAFAAGSAVSPLPAGLAFPAPWRYCNAGARHRAFSRLGHSGGFKELSHQRGSYLQVLGHTYDMKFPLCYSYTNILPSVRSRDGIFLRYTAIKKGKESFSFVKRHCFIHSVMFSHLQFPTPLRSTAPTPAEVTVVVIHSLDGIVRNPPFRRQKSQRSYCWPKQKEALGPR